MNRLTFVSTFVLSAVAIAPFASANNLAVKPNVAPTATQVATYQQYQGTTRSLDLRTAFKDPDASAAVRVETVLGTMNFTLDGETTPITVANFLNYVDSGRYYMTDPTNGERASVFFHRSVPDFVIQTGGFIGTVNPNGSGNVQATEVPTFPAIQNEPVISNRRGTIAMAKLSGNANSATSQWFINLDDNSHNVVNGTDYGLDHQNGGFTVFGRVAGTGMTVADAISELPRPFVGTGGVFAEIPLRNYSSPNYVKVPNLVSIPQITRISPLQFSASSSNTGVATVAVSGTNLLIKANATGSAQISVTATDLDGAAVSQTFTVDVIPAAPRLLNISTRVEVGTGSNVLIGGFIVQGGSSKRLLVRAIGPSLADDNVTDPLNDPILELRTQSGTLIASNDNWNDAPNRQEIIDTGVPPSAAAEAAILMTVPSGSQITSYTAIVRGRDEKSGVGLVEVYDLDSGPGSTLANISTRGQVGVNDDVMIGGFILAGNVQKEILLRGLGPSLSNSNVSNPLSNPKLELYNSQGTKIAENDNWETHPTSERIEAMNLDPSDSLESAMIHPVTPGPYTAIIRGTGDTPTGVALVEAYLLP